MKLVAVLLMSLLSIACQDYSSYYTYHPPQPTNDGINVGTLAAVGMDSLVLAKAVGGIWGNKYDQVHSVLIYKDGMLVFEEYFEGNKYDYFGLYHYGERIQWHRDSLHVLMSCTKSVVSALAGIAVDQGHLDVQQSIFDYLPNHQQYRTPAKEKITVEHLLTMSSGFEFDEWSRAHGSRANDIDRLHWDCQQDPIACVLERPLIHNPGERFNYNSGCTIVLGEIIKNATGRDLADFCDEFLFEPLGIKTALWRRFENGVVRGDGGLEMTSRDMLKIGICFLNDGLWNDRRIIPSSWVELSRENFGNNYAIKVPGSDLGRQGYSYSWWTKEVKSPRGDVKTYAASGWGGQKIIVIDELDMVVVFTGGNYVVKTHYRKILERFILPSITQGT